VRIYRITTKHSQLTDVSTPHVASDLASGVVGLVKQMKFAHATSIVSTTSTSGVDLDSMSISITPNSSTNKILCLFVTRLSHETADEGVAFNLVRDSTSLTTTFVISPIGSTNGGKTCATMLYLDTPGDTNSHTYKITWNIDTGTGYCKYRDFLVMEIEG